MLKRAADLVQRVTSVRFVRDVGTLGMSNVVVAALLFTQGVLVARWLGPAQYGIAALIMSYPGILLSIFDARSSAATVKYVGEFSSQKNPAAVLSMCKLSYLVDALIALLTLIVVLATAGWAERHIVHAPGVASLMLVYTLSYFFRALSVPSRSILSILGRFSTIAWTETISTAIGVTVILSLVRAGWGVTGVVLGHVTVQVISGLAFVTLAHPMIVKRWGSSWVSVPWAGLRGRFREILRFLLFTEMIELVNIVGKRADLVILGFFSGPAEAGYYRLAKKLTGVVGMVVEPLQSVLYPRLSKFWGSAKRVEGMRTLKRYVLWVALPLAGAVLLSLPLLPLFLQTVAGAEYLAAARTFQVLMGTAAIWMALSWVRPLLLTLGSVRFIFIRSALVNGLCVVGFVVAAPRWGGLGVACAALIISVVFGYALEIFYCLGQLRKESLKADRLGTDMEAA